jgi:TatD DNase family protein
VPLDRCLIETDSPYLAPMPLRGKLNTPANVPLVAAYARRSEGPPGRADRGGDHVEFRPALSRNCSTKLKRFLKPAGAEVLQVRFQFVR